MRWCEITPKNNGLWFQHQSSGFFKTLKPQSYSSLLKIRNEEGNIYLNDRLKTEKIYHQLTDQPSDMSFLYATIVGYNNMDDPMDDPMDYLGYTYYFQLDENQINECIFDIVDKKVWMKPTTGINGLNLAMSIWKENWNKFQQQEDDILGVINSRIEVIIPFDVKYFKYLPQIEDRQ